MFEDVNAEQKALDKAMAMNCISCVWNRECENKQRKDKYTKACDDYCPEITVCDI